LLKIGPKPTKARRMKSHSVPDTGKFSLRDALLKWLPALITGLVLGFAVVIFSHRQ
jgi:hypothetical protein